AIFNRLLAVPSLKARYLQHVRTIAEEYLDWSKLQVTVNQYRSLIEKEVEADTRKLYTLAAFKSGVGPESTEAAAGNRQSGMSLKAFAEQRRSFLLNHQEIKKLTP
ncbi:MAG: CotH kinase family protein, partial [Bacillota bacterium]